MTPLGYGSSDVHHFADLAHVPVQQSCNFQQIKHIVSAGCCSQPQLLITAVVLVLQSIVYCTANIACNNG
jgi:hypothetical protein